MMLFIGKARPDTIRRCPHENLIRESPTKLKTGDKPAPARKTAIARLVQSSEPNIDDEAVDRQRVGVQSLAGRLRSWRKSRVTATHRPGGIEQLVGLPLTARLPPGSQTPGPATARRPADGPRPRRRYWFAGLDQPCNRGLACRCRLVACLRLVGDFTDQVLHVGSVEWYQAVLADEQHHAPMPPVGSIPQ